MLIFPSASGCLAIDVYKRQGLNLYVEKETLPKELLGIVGGLYSGKEEAGKVDKNLLIGEIVNCLMEEDVYKRQEYRSFLKRRKVMEAGRRQFVLMKALFL